MFKHRICLLLNKNDLHIFLTKLGFLKVFKHTNNKMIYPVQVGFMPSHAKEVHFRYLLSPRRKENIFKNSPILYKKILVEGSMPAQCVNLWFLVTDLQGFMLSVIKDT